MPRVITFEEIQAARKRIEGAVYYSPCPESIPLSEITGMKIFSKLDYLQRTGSFKERGARNALAQLTPEQQKRGANVVLHGKDFTEAKEHAHEIAKERGLAYIDGYDDPAIIAGQGTMGLEIVEQTPDLEAAIVPVGGAGLLAGVSLAVKTLRPKAKIVAV